MKIEELEKTAKHAGEYIEWCEDDCSPGLPTTLEIIGWIVLGLSFVALVWLLLCL